MHLVESVFYFIFYYTTRHSSGAYNYYFSKRVLCGGRLARQVRVPSIEWEPPTIGIEDEDPGVRLEVRLGCRGWLVVGLSQMR